jgi:nucleoside-diphosphate-sugar epimerase
MSADPTAASSAVGPVLLYGANGYFGSHMLKHLERAGLPFVLGKARLEDRPSLVAEIAAIKPRYVICAAGLAGTPNIDWCESHKQETIRVNVIGTLNIADACFVNNVHCSVFGSGCIYEYDATHPMGSGIGFKEEDTPNFQGSFYVKTRVLLEPLALQFPNLLYLRVRFPISDDMHARSVLSKLIGYEKVVNVPNSFTVLDDLLPLVPKMAEKGLTGLVNLVNPGVISHNELLQFYKEYIDPELSWKNFTVEEQAQVLKAGRSNNELDCAKLLSHFPDVPEIHASMHALFARMKAAGIKPRPKTTASATPAAAATC